MARNQKPKDDLGREVDLERLVTAYVVADEEFDVELPLGEVLRFKAIKRPSDLKALYAAGAAMFASLPKPGTKAASVHPWNGFLPETQDEFFSAFKISELSVSPKIPHLTALKLLRNAFLIEYLETAIESHSKTMTSLKFVKAVDEAKKNLMATVLNASESAAPSKSSDDTPTS